MVLWELLDEAHEVFFGDSSGKCSSSEDYLNRNNVDASIFIRLLEPTQDFHQVVDRHGAIAGMK
jgi:hypothetical protein